MRSYASLLIIMHCNVNAFKPIGSSGNFMHYKAEHANKLRSANLRFFTDLKKIISLYSILFPKQDARYAVAQLVDALRYKPEGRRFDSRWCHWNFSLT